MASFQIAGSRVTRQTKRYFVALLFFVVTIVMVNFPCSAVDTSPTSSTPNFHIFRQDEAEVMNAVLRNWTVLKSNPQLTTFLSWSRLQHPCNSSRVFNYSDDNVNVFDKAFGTYGYLGAWGGVKCRSVLTTANQTGNYYDVFVTSLRLSANLLCNTFFKCGFEGIKGVLLPEIGKLQNLTEIWITDNPQLTGPVPIEIYHLPNLEALNLSNNSLSGTLPNTNASVKRTENDIDIDLSRNNISGNLQVSSDGMLFGLNNLRYLRLSSNQLDGHVDLQQLDVNASKALRELDLTNNQFNGTFITGPYFRPYYLRLANNEFTSLRLHNLLEDNVVGRTIEELNVSNNKIRGPFPREILFDAFNVQNLILQKGKILDLSNNNFYGAVDLRNNRTTVLKLKYLNLSNNNFNGTIFISNTILADNSSSLETVDLSNNYFENITCVNEATPRSDASNESYLPALVTLNIENNKLSDAKTLLPYLKSSKLQVLNMGNNNFNGMFPSEIFSNLLPYTLYAGQNQYTTMHLPDIAFQNFSLSTQISLIHNKIKAVQYANVGPFSRSYLQYSNVLFLGGNPICNKIENELLSTLCRYNQTSPRFKVVPRSNTKLKIIIATPILASFVLLLLITSLYIWRLMHNIRRLRVILKEFEKNEVNPNVYSYKEIKLATKSFDETCKLGEGAFGVVYKGELFDGTIVAVKKLTMQSDQVLSEFLNEVVVISGLKHRNLVKLKGCCLGDGDQRMLVFEYVENKTLAEALVLSGQLKDYSKAPNLDWKKRFNIIIGIARGIAYLHEELQSQIIHRDIKATNILLDKDYNAKIVDFGLAYLFPLLNNEASHLTLMQIVGTRGYCPPEYAIQGHVSTAIDVYSFGILVLEIISGRKCIDLKKSEDEVDLREWTWKHYKDQTLLTLVDERMNHSSEDLEAIMRVFTVALACVHYKAAMRPKMRDVIIMILGTIPIDDFSEDFEFGEEIMEVVPNITMS